MFCGRTLRPFVPAIPYFLLNSLFVLFNSLILRFADFTDDIYIFLCSYYICVSLFHLMSQLTFHFFESHDSWIQHIYHSTLALWECVKCKSRFVESRMYLTVSTMFGPQSTVAALCVVCTVRWLSKLSLFSVVRWARMSGTPGAWRGLR